MRKFLTQTQLKTDADVQLFVAAFNEPKIGTKVLCGNPEHSSVFRIFSDIILDRTRYAVVWGSRSGSKTYLFGGLDTWYKSASRPQYETKILGGSEGQSILSYDAIKQFRYLSDPDNILVKRLLTTKADFYNRAKVSILRASSRSVRGPHPQCLKLDEVDEIDERVFEDALSQPMSKYGYPPSLIMFSTNHNIGGQMDRAIERATEKGYPVYKYCVWETLESCRDYECSTCKLSAICPGKQMKEADGYYKIEDFIDKLNTLSFAALSRDWLCIKTGVGDTVYEQEWDENIHLCAVDLRMDEPVILSVDFGGVDPFSCGVWQKSPGGKEFGSDSWIRVTELYMTSEKESTTNQNFIAKAKAAPWATLVREIIPDNSRPDLIQEWRTAFPKAKFTIVDKGTIDEGIEAVKSALRPVLGPPKLYVNRICLHTRREVQMYKIKNGKTVDKNNHCYDDKTEILTEHGWKLFKDLDKTEKVASLDDERNLIWTLPAEYVEFDYTGDLYEYENRHFGFGVTPNHNMLAISQFDAKKSIEYNPRFIPIEDIVNAVGKQNKGKRNRSSQWWIPMKCNPEKGRNRWESPIAPYALGFWLAEGCKSISGAKKYPMKYVNFDNTNYDRLVYVSGILGYTTKPYKVGDIEREKTCYRLSLRSDYLYDLLPKQRSWEKRIPRWFMENAGVEQLNRLFQGMMDGDGCWRVASSHYNTSSEGLASDFQELLIRIGGYGTIRKVGHIGDTSYFNGGKLKTAKHDHYRVIVNSNKYIYKTLDGKKLVKTPYSGKVYCVRVEPYHTLMVRRNGSTMWCGNTWDEIRYFTLAKIKRIERFSISTIDRNVFPE